MLRSCRRSRQHEPGAQGAAPTVTAAVNPSARMCHMPRSASQCHASKLAWSRFPRYRTLRSSVGRGKYVAARTNRWGSMMTGSQSRSQYIRAVATFNEALAAYRTAVRAYRLALERRRKNVGPSSLGPNVVPLRTALVLQQHANRSPARQACAASCARLSRRQSEVAELIARGCTNAEIAQQLVIANGTTANHVAAILTRLGAVNRTQVAALVTREMADPETSTGVATAARFAVA